MEVTAIGVMRSGRLHFSDRLKFDQDLAQFKEGASVEITVTHRRANRSHQQNKYYWGVVIHLISDHTGYGADELHDMLKSKFIPKILAFRDGNGTVLQEWVVGGSTTKMDTVDFGRYIDDIRQWAAEALDVFIPDPA